MIWRHWICVALGGLLFLQGLGKALDLPGYQLALEAFGLLGVRGIAPVSWLWALVELASGAWLVFAALAGRLNGRSAQIAATLIVIVNLSYTILNGWAYATDLPIGNCTCFGVFAAQPLSPFVLAQDVGVILWAVWALGVTRRPA